MCKPGKMLIISFLDRLVNRSIKANHFLAVKCGYCNAVVVVVSQPMVEELEQRLTALSALLSAERRLLKERRKDIDNLEKEVRDVYHSLLLVPISFLGCVTKELCLITTCPYNAAK